MGNNELYHYGRKGMKWGQNIFGKKKSWRAKKKTINPSEDAKTVSDLRKKSVGEMSNAELRKINERSQLERTYSQLHPSKIQRGWKHVVTAAGVMSTALTIYNNSDKLVKNGKAIVDKILAKK